ncbi:hypothetical protein H4S08_004468 [Coemansia sp. RSA 1365]|nr:hypothetical protein H4S08_004468 [Coemansia sp. RSA 1365]
MEHAGGSFLEFFKKESRNRSGKIIDILAAYLHTMLAAATGHNGKFVLHRDISANNLMVRNGKPYIIDWGCGLIGYDNRDRIASMPGRVGTAPFMGVRVLMQYPPRSVMDDLESLFLVHSYCLWLNYGDASTPRFSSLWQGASEPAKVCDERYLWLGSEVQYLREMNLAGCPNGLRELGVYLYRLLFGAAGCTMGEVLNWRQDPRLTRFDASKWLQALENAIKLCSPSAAESQVHLDRLRKFVKENPQCGRFGTMIPQPKQELQQQTRRTAKDTENILGGASIPAKGKRKASTVLEGFKRGKYELQNRK